MGKEKLTKELIRVIKRLSLNESDKRFRYNNFKETIKKIELKKPSLFDAILLKKTDKEELSEFIEVKYYQGKIMAYMWVLEQLVGNKKMTKLLFKNTEGDKNYDKYGKRIKK